MALRDREDSQTQTGSLYANTILREFWHYLTKKMNLSSMEHSQLDPVLCWQQSLCICYIGDSIFWVIDWSEIDELANELIYVGVSLEQESDATGFLEVRMETDPNRIEADWHDWSSDWNSWVGNWKDFRKIHSCRGKPFVKDADGHPVLGDFC